MTDQKDQLPNTAAEPRRAPSRRLLTGGAVLLALAIGAVGGAEGMRFSQRWHPQPVMLLKPVTIEAMQPDSQVAVKGQVAEIFGNKFVIQDSSGRALVDTGPAGEGRHAVKDGESVTVQGHFDRDVLHAQLVMDANGRTESFGPPPPPHGPKHPGPHATRVAPPPPAAPAQ